MNPLQVAWALLLQARWHEAFSLYESLLATHAWSPQLWVAMSFLAVNCGERQRALNFFRRAYTLDQTALFLPSRADFGRCSRAFIDVLLKLMQIIFERDDGFEHEFRVHLLQYLRTCPFSGEQAYQLATLFYTHSQLTEAEFWGRRALSQGVVQVRVLLILILFARGLKEQALAVVQALLSDEPDNIYAYLLAGYLLTDLQQFERAVQVCQQGLECAPEEPSLLYYLASLYQLAGDFERAAPLFRGALLQVPHQAFWRLQAELNIPYAPESSFVLNHRLEVLFAKLTAICEPLDLLSWQADLARQPLDTLFKLHYLIDNPLNFKVAFAACFKAPSTPLFHIKQKPLTLAVCVTPGHEGVFYFASGKLFSQLDLERFQVKLLIWPASYSIFNSLLPDLGLYILDSHWERMIQNVQAQRFDLFYFWESGTDPWNYFMPFFRLGRVQFTSWGSAGSTGIPQMDYFVSCQALEGPAPQARYTERLLLMKQLPIWYDSSMLLISEQSRQELGLPDDGRLLVLFPHNLLKLHPDFDSVLGAIFRQCPDAILVLVAAYHPDWTARVAARLSRQLASEQFVILPRLTPTDFSALLRIGDFGLDPWPYGAGKIAFEALGLSLPLLTWPQDTLKGRIVAACYAVLEMTECLATSPGDYVQKAVRLCRDAVWRAHIRHLLHTRKHRLFQNDAAVREFSDVLAMMGAV